MSTQIEVCTDFTQFAKPVLEKFEKMSKNELFVTRQAENRAALAKSQRAIERKKLLDILAAKKDEKLSQASIEDLEKKLAALDD